MQLRGLKYLLVHLLPVTVYVSFISEGLLTLLPVFVFFIIVPIIEVFIPPDRSNLDSAVAREESKKLIYDYILLSAVPVQLFFLFYFFDVMGKTPMGSVEFYGRVFSMGLMCGIMGINVGHELGHRRTRWMQLMGEILLLTSLDTHFLPYHNAGHHRNVATPGDSATARKDEWLYWYWLRSHFGSYREAWQLEGKRLAINGKHWFSLGNRMVIYSVANVLVLVSIYHFYDAQILMSFLLAATVGVLLLETVNYIEHYGLLRTKNKKGRYGPVRHHHSWNSDHPIGRLVLFNLSRHSDHHYNGSKKYQVLHSHARSPQMPTGYPGMMLLALIPPLWFSVMNPQLAPYRDDLLG